MATATRTTKSGIQISASVERTITATAPWMDGWSGEIRKSTSERRRIILRKDGKVIAEASAMIALPSQYAHMAAQGVVGMVGRTYISAEAAALIAEAVAEAEAAAPKSAEYLALEAAETKAEAADARPATQNREDARLNALMRDMDRQDSDN